MPKHAFSSIHISAGQAEFSIVLNSDDTFTFSSITPSQVYLAIDGGAKFAMREPVTIGRDLPTAARGDGPLRPEASSSRPASPLRPPSQLGS